MEALKEKWQKQQTGSVNTPGKTISTTDSANTDDEVAQLRRELEAQKQEAERNKADLQKLAEQLKKNESTTLIHSLRELTENMSNMTRNKDHPVTDGIISNALKGAGKKFSGYDSTNSNKDELNRWIERMDSCFTTIGVILAADNQTLKDEWKLSIALMQLDHEPRKWMEKDIMKDAANISYQDFIKKIHERYDPADAVLHPYKQMLNLDLTSAGVKGDVDKYFHRLEEHLSRAENIPENMKITLVREAIKPSEQLFSKINSRVPKATYEEEKKEVRERAKTISINRHNEGNSYVVALITCNHCQGYHTSDVCRVKNTRPVLLEERRTSRNDRRDRSRDRDRRKSDPRSDRSRDRSPRDDRSKGRSLTMSDDDILKEAKRIQTEKDKALRRNYGDEKFLRTKKADLENRMHQLYAYVDGRDPEKTPGSKASRKLQQEEGG